MFGRAWPPALLGSRIAGVSLLLAGGEGGPGGPYAAAGRLRGAFLALMGPRGLAGKPLAGFCTTPSRRITVVYGVIVYAIRFKTPSLHR